MFKIQGVSVFIDCENVRKRDKMKYRQRKESKSYLQGLRWKNQLLKGNKDGGKAVLFNKTRLG